MTGGQHWRAFGSLFFLLHQDRLIWLLNAPLIGTWFRWILRINGESSSVGRRSIFRILPHAIFWWDGDKQVAEFRTHDKFSKRLYYAFAPLWWAMHAWDWAIADRWVPQLSFQFSTLTKYPDADPETNTVDGVVEVALADLSAESWATIRGRADGTDAWPSSADDSVLWLKCGTGSNLYRGLARPFYLYDTSALTASAAISAAVKSVYGSSLVYVTGGFSPDISANIVTTTPASNTNLTTADFDQQGTVVQCDTAIGIASWNQAGYNNWTLNATGLGNISKTGITKLGIRENNYDRPNTTPTWGSGALSQCTGYYADQAGTANDPKLVVTYHIPGSFVRFTHTLSST